ncbi:hypothetical protein PLESTB_001261600 [Pleodorina starrii]|uniref:Uncharacterized protein n=1 Tax=Pleodorina starrii TaxID=330485 RepID=A0A9W6BTA6_9CHLO|nr:hypothetical protein PLESTM_000908900 [Pleodorina starrii]GLC57758.1 hypothetical protein PLESTB_001261600 [Pleodorina starrii]
MSYNLLFSPRTAVYHPSPTTAATVTINPNHHRHVHQRFQKGLVEEARRGGGWRRVPFQEKKRIVGVEAVSEDQKRKLFQACTTREKYNAVIFTMIARVRACMRGTWDVCMCVGCMWDVCGVYVGCVWDVCVCLVGRYMRGCERRAATRGPLGELEDKRRCGGGSGSS